MGLMERTTEGAIVALEAAVNFFIGRPPPAEVGRLPKSNPIPHPFYNERDQWYRDPFYREGLLLAPFAPQFRKDPFGTISRSLQAHLFG